MYVKRGEYSIVESNTKIEQKFYNFLTLLKPVLKGIEDAGDAYVLLLPYTYAVVYDSTTSKYEYSVEYAIINNTKYIEPQKSIKSLGVRLQHDSNRDDFIKDIKYALDKKSAENKYILATSYPLYEELHQMFAEEIGKGEIKVKSVYTVGLYYYISKMVNNDNINKNIDISDLCSSLDGAIKTFSSSKIASNDNLLIANRSALSMAGLNRHSAQTALTLPKELMEGLAMFYGFRLNAPNVICKGASQLVKRLLSITSMYSNSIFENDGFRYYATTESIPYSSISIPKDLEPYVEIAWKLSKIVFENTPEEIESFIALLNSDFLDYLKDIVSSHARGAGYEKNLFSLIKGKNEFDKLNDSKKGLIKYVQYLYHYIQELPLASARAVLSSIDAVASVIAAGFSIKEEKRAKEAIPLAALIHMYIHLIRYRDSAKLIPKSEWKFITAVYENIIKMVMGLDLKPPQSVPQNKSKTTTDNTAPSDTSTSPPPTNVSSKSSTPSNQPTIASNQNSSNNQVYILSSERFIDCDLFDSEAALKYCQVLLPRDKHNEIGKDPFRTVIDIAEYICNFSGGMFSNIDQIYKLEVNEVPDVPISFNGYNLTNLMIHTCDQRKDAIKILYRQAKVDIETIANNIALDIINDKFSANSNNEYFVNIIILKSKHVNVGFSDLEDLTKKFHDIVYERVTNMSFALDDKTRDKVLKDTKDTYKFKANLYIVHDDDDPDLEKILRKHKQYCQNVVYMLDDHQHLHEMHIPLDEVERYILHAVFYHTKYVKVPLTGYAHYVIAYALHYRNSNNPATDAYKPKTIYRVIMNSKSFSHDYVRLLAYIYLLFDIRNLRVLYKNEYIKKDITIDIKDELENIVTLANNASKRTIAFSNKPYTVSLKAIQRFINKVKSKTWYSYGFSRCNPERKQLFEEYYKISNQVYENFIKSPNYQDYAHQIISACQADASNAMDNDIGRVYLSIIKPHKLRAINKATNQSSQYNIYFEKIKMYVESVVTDINNLYNKFAKKLNGYDTPNIDYNIETKLLNNAFKSKRKMDMKAKLRFLDELELDYIERTAYIMSAYMLTQLRATFKHYQSWVSVLDAVFRTGNLSTLLGDHITALSEETYKKVDNLGRALGLSETEKVILLLNYLYLNSLYTEENQDIEETFRVLTEDLLVTSVSETSIHRTQMLIAGIRMFLQNFICDLYSKSKDNEFMDANRFSGSYLIICEDSDIAAALASSLSILLHFRAKTDKAMKEIELVARQFYSNVFKTLYKHNTKWYEKIKDIMIGTNKNNYYNKELQFIDLTINAMRYAMTVSKNFINGKHFNSDYPLYGLSALVFILSIPMVVSLAIAVGDKDSTNSMISMVYKYQDAMSAHGITLVNSYCRAGYEQPELELPDNTELSHITDFPVSTNLISKEQIFGNDNYNDAITTISEVLTHRAKTMDQNYGQVIVTDDITRIMIDMSNVNTIIILASRRNTFSQSERQGAVILDKQIADSLYEQTGRKANVYYVAFEYDSRIDDMMRDSYLRPRFNTNIQDLYSVINQVNQIRTAKSKGSRHAQASQYTPIVLTIAII